jgi:hypothetical protein
VIDRYEMRLAEQQFPLLDGEKFDGEISCRHLLEFYGMRKASHRLRPFAERAVTEYLAEIAPITPP